MGKTVLYTRAALMALKGGISGYEMLSHQENKMAFNQIHSHAICTRRYQCSTH
jgi:hypothetical protein